MNPPPETATLDPKLAEREAIKDINQDYKTKFGFNDPETGYVYKAPKGLSRELVQDISEYKDEPQWMRDFRLKALDHFLARPVPQWGANLNQIDFDNIHYFVRASERAETSWDDVPDDIKNTFDKLGIPEAERQFLSGVGAQYESEVVYHQVNEKLEAQGVQFMDMDTALREHEDVIREHFATVIPANDNMLAALNSAVWSGGSFVYVPPGRQGRHAAAGLLPDQHREHGPVRADADHRRRGRRRALHRGLHRAGLLDRLAALRRGRADRPPRRADPLHDRPELVAERLQPGHQARDVAERDATVEWVDCNLGSKVTMKYPSIYLMGERAHGEILSIAFAGNGQHQDAGGKIIHAAPKTTSSIFAKSISKDGGRSTYRGLLEVAKGATEARSKVVCDALLLDPESRSDTYPTIRIDESDANVGHEASVSKIGEEQLYYLQCARPRRGGGLEDDRQRLHRAGRQGAADGVRGRAQPPDRAADGRLDWLARSPPREPDWLVERRAKAVEAASDLALPGPEGQRLGVHRPLEARPRRLRAGRARRGRRAPTRRRGAARSPRARPS